MPRGPRTPYTDAERISLRQRRQQFPFLSQSDLRQWFESEYGKPIKQSTVSLALSDHFSYLDEIPENASSTRLARQRRRQNRWPDLEAALSAWTAQQQHAQRVTDAMIREKAKWFWHRLPQYQDQPEPPWSNGWLSAFKERNDVRNRVRSSRKSRVSSSQHNVSARSEQPIDPQITSATNTVDQSLRAGYINNSSAEPPITTTVSVNVADPQNTNTTEDSLGVSHRVRSIEQSKVAADLAKIQADLAKWPVHDRYVCDATSLFWRTVPQQGASKESMPGCKGRERLSIHLCANADGSHKLKPWIIGRYRRPRCFEAAGVGIQRFDCVYRANRNSAMTSSIMTEWLRWFDNEMNGRNVVCVLDLYSMHTIAMNNVDGTTASRVIKNTTFLWIPPNASSRAQPLTRIFTFFKALYRRNWLHYVIEELDSDRAPDRTMNILKAVRFIIRSWNEVSKYAIADYWSQSSLRESANLSGGGRIRQPAQEKEATFELDQLLKSLQQRQQIDGNVTIKHLTEPAEEEILDSSEHVAELLAAEYEPVPEQESDDDDITILPRIMPTHALELVRQLRLYEEQAADCNSGWLQSLDQYERTVQKREQQRMLRRPAMDVSLLESI